MATTKIWKIDKRLDNVVDYVVNEKKTDSSSYYNLHKVAEYVKASYKTEKQLYVTAINCSEDNIVQEMMETKRLFDKEDGILGYHAFQSFCEGEVTPELAHKIGIKLAEELWGDRFQVVVTTHLNTNHIHNHFLLNSVSFAPGRTPRTRPAPRGRARPPSAEARSLPPTGRPTLPPISRRRRRTIPGIGARGAPPGPHTAMPRPGRSRRRASRRKRLSSFAASPASSPGGASP